MDPTPLDYEARAELAQDPTFQGRCVFAACLLATSILRGDGDEVSNANRTARVGLARSITGAPMDFAKRLPFAVLVDASTEGVVNASAIDDAAILAALKSMWDVIAGTAG